jgi:hypothetical protein
MLISVPEYVQHGMFLRRNNISHQESLITSPFTSEAGKGLVLSNKFSLLQQVMALATSPHYYN